MRLIGIVTACVCARVPAVTAAGALAGAFEDALTVGLATAEGPWATIAGAMKPAAARARLAVTERRRRLVIEKTLVDACCVDRGQCSRLLRSDSFVSFSGMQRGGTLQKATIWCRCGAAHCGRLASAWQDAL